MGLKEISYAILIPLWIIDIMGDFRLFWKIELLRVKIQNIDEASAMYMKKTVPILINNEMNSF